MNGFDPFDLGPMVPIHPIYPCYTPLRRRLSGPETHAERMARTDAQLEREKRERAMLAALDAAMADWTAVNEAYGKSPAVQEVLKLHGPVLDNMIAITCNECCACDYYGEGAVEWPCGTFRVVKELL
jgi:hypothetical protein